MNKTYDFQLPKQLEWPLPEKLEALKLCTCAAGIALATNHYPRVIRDPDVLEALARAATVQMRSMYQSALTNDFPLLASTFIAWVMHGYQNQVVRCDADPAQADRDKYALAHLDGEPLNDYFTEQARLC